MADEEVAVSLSAWAQGRPWWRFVAPMLAAGIIVILDDPEAPTASFRHDGFGLIIHKLGRGAVKITRADSGPWRITLAGERHAIRQYVSDVLDAVLVAATASAPDELLN